MVGRARSKSVSTLIIVEEAQFLAHFFGNATTKVITRKRSDRVFMINIIRSLSANVVGVQFYCEYGRPMVVACMPQRGWLLVRAFEHRALEFGPFQVTREDPHKSKSSSIENSMFMSCGIRVYGCEARRTCRASECGTHSVLVQT